MATDSHGDLDATYKALADGCGLQFQLDYFKGLARDSAEHPGAHVVADVNYLESKTEYDRLVKEDPAFAVAMAARDKAAAQAPTDPFLIFLSLWKQGTDDQKRILGLACRGFFSWAYAQTSQVVERDKLILDFRNARLAKMIADTADDKIYVTYGARHVTGLIDDLKAIDPHWRVEAVKWAPVIANPQVRKGELQ